MQAPFPNLLKYSQMLALQTPSKVPCDSSTVSASLCRETDCSVLQHMV